MRRPVGESQPPRPRPSVAGASCGDHRSQHSAAAVLSRMGSSGVGSTDLAAIVARFGDIIVQREQNDMSELTRRSFARAAVAAAFLTARARAKPLEPLSPGIKISMQVNEDVTDDDLTWVKQM